MNLNSENLNSPSKSKSFNNPERFIEGWYWALPSHNLRIGELKPITVLGRDLVIYRGTDKRAVILDAYCPHMGAHLAAGKIEANELRCFYHQWKFDAEGICVDIPCLDEPIPIKARTWPTQENYGMIWVWTGETPQQSLPFLPELVDHAYDVIFGKTSLLNCHPNVMMVNAIDGQHFQTIHKMSPLSFDKEELNHNAILFSNITSCERDSWLIKLIRRLSKISLNYSVCYWYGSTGIISFGLRRRLIHIMFAMRLGKGGRAEGQTIYLIKKQRGIWAFLSNLFLLNLTKIWAKSFINEDNKLFQTIRFDLKSPLDTDQSILQFINHLEKQKPLQWRTWNFARSREVEVNRVRKKSQDELIND
jgi:phenylpropionate dioxygenase-like ring-hydroxylating dioxygenase large terminal subunit